MGVIAAGEGALLRTIRRYVHIGRPPVRGPGAAGHALGGGCAGAAAAWPNPVVSAFLPLRVGRQEDNYTDTRIVAVLCLKQERISTSTVLGNAFGDCAANGR